MTADRGHSRQRALGTAGIATALALLIALFDPLGLDRAGDRRSAEAVNRVAALFYPSDHGRDRITTVQIDEASLRSVGREWPPQYDFYAEVLDTLMPGDDAAPNTGPGAIFLDFTFMSELYSAEKRDQFVAKVHEVTRAAQWTDRPDCHQTPVAKLRCIVDAGGTPVIIGKPYPADRCDLNYTVLLLDRAAILTPLGWPGMGDAWRPAISNRQYQAQRDAHRPGLRGGAREPCPALDGVEAGGRKASFEYRPLVSEDAFGAPTITLTAWGVPRYDLTPSAALFGAICLRYPGAARHCGGPGSATLESFLSRENTYTVLWGSVPDPAYLTLEEKLFPSRADVERRARCRREAGNLARVLQVGFAQLLAGLGDHDAAMAVECGYHADLRYELLAGDDLDPRLARTIDERFIAGRAVIVGVALVQSNDWTESPTRGRVPGLNLHAMALDNLLELGDRMQAPPPDILNGPLDAGEVVEVVLTFFMTLTIAAANDRAPAGDPAAPDARSRRRRRLTLAMASVAGSLLVFVLVSLFLAAVLRWTPVNIVGLWLLSVTVAFVSFRDSLAAAANDGAAWLRRVVATFVQRRPDALKTMAAAGALVIVALISSAILIAGLNLPAGQVAWIWTAAAALGVGVWVVRRTRAVMVARAARATPTASSPPTSEETSQ